MIEKECGSIYGTYLPFLVWLLVDICIMFEKILVVLVALALSPFIIVQK